jgi:hypothetical protein
MDADRNFLNSILRADFLAPHAWDRLFEIVISGNDELVGRVAHAWRMVEAPARVNLWLRDVGAVRA